MSQGYAHFHPETIIDEHGFAVDASPTGDLRAVIPTRLVGSNFEGGTVDPNFWTASTALTGTVTQANNQIVLDCGINAAALAQLNSVRRGRYVGGSPNTFRAVVQLSAGGLADNTRQWGMAYGAAMPTITNGAWFQWDDLTFAIVTMKGSAATTVTSGNFNGDWGTTFDPGVISHTYEIIFTNSLFLFVVDNRLLHSVSSTAATASNTSNFYIHLSNFNTGNTTSTLVSCRVASIRRLGPLTTQPTSFYQAGTVAAQVLKYGAGNLHELLISGVTNNSVVTLYDNTAAAGTILFSTGAMATNATPFALDFKGTAFSNGLTLAITAANSNATVIYE